MISAREARSETNEAKQRIKEAAYENYIDALSKIQNRIVNSANDGEDKIVIDNSDDTLYDYLYDEDNFSKVEKTLRGLDYSVVKNDFNYPYINITIGWGEVS